MTADSTCYYTRALIVFGGARAGQLHQPLARHGRSGLQCLGCAPVIAHSHLLGAGDRAVGSAPLCRIELAAKVLEGIFAQRYAGRAALLGTPGHQSVLADIKAARARTAAPFVGFATRDIVQELVKPR